MADFTLAIEVDPGHPEAHTGLGYVRACQKQFADAQLEALKALLRREKRPQLNDYMIFHNVACIHAEIALADPGQTLLQQDQALTVLHRAVESWRVRPAIPSEIELMGQEASFKPFSSRPEFRDMMK